MSYSDATVEDFLRQAASGNPTPGGGGVAALAGALGGSMASMVANFTVGKPQFAEHEEKVQTVLKTMLPLIEDFRAAIDDDASAFSGIADAYKLPRDTDDAKARRKDAIQAALTASMKVPLRVLRCSREAVDMLPELAKHGNPNLLSDAEVAAIMLVAAAKAALVNIYANSSALKTPEAREAEAEGESVVKHCEQVAETVTKAIRERNNA